MSKTTIKYKVLAEKLKTEIRDGFYEDKMPSINTLSLDYQLNNRTVIRPLDILEEDGFVKRKPQHGTFITRLKRKRTNTIGLVLPDVDSPQGHRLYEGVKKQAEKHGQKVLCESYREDSAKCLDLVKDLLFNYQVGGILFWIPDEIRNKDLIDFLEKEELPFVVISPSSSYAFDHCHTEDLAHEHAANDIMKHLFKQNFSNIAFACDEVFLNNRSFKTRYAQYRKSLARKHYKEHDLIVLKEGENKELLLSQFDSIDAIFCMTDNVAAKLMSLFLRNGISCPGDIALVAYDNTDLAQKMGLSSVDLNSDKAGYLATEILLSEVEGQNSGLIHKEVRSKLIVRESSLIKKKF